jgi:hypothetical protein
MKVVKTLRADVKRPCPCFIFTESVGLLAQVSDDTPMCRTMAPALRWHSPEAGREHEAE